MRNQTKFQRRVGSIKLRNCHRGNVAEPDLWDLWPLEMGPVAAHILIIHSVKEMGGMSYKKGFRDRCKREIFPRQRKLNFHTDATRAKELREKISPRRINIYYVRS